MQTLPNEMLDHIFSYLEEYNFVIRQVSPLWRDLSKEISLLAYYNRLLLDGRSLPKEIKLTSSLLLSLLQESYLALLDYYYQKGENKVRALFTSLSDLYFPSISSLQWLKERNLLPSTWKNSKEAAARGRIDLLQWWREIQTLEPCLYCFAGGNGQIEVLEWLKKEKVPFPVSSPSTLAAYEGCIPSLQWFKREGGIVFGEEEYFEAAKGGNVEILFWLEEEGCLERFIPAAYSFALVCKEGKLEAVKHLYFRGLPYDELAFAYAGRSGNVELLEWMREKGFPYDERIVSYAVYEKDYNVILWLKERNYPYSEELYSNAVESRDINYLEWLKNLFPLKEKRSTDAVSYALAMGLEDIVKWLVREGFPVAHEQRDHPLLKNSC